jgi:hypothetical protein
MLDALRDKLTHRKPRPESDAPGDTGVARSLDEGGVPQPDAPDQNSTTGTTPGEEFVGRAQGQDVGYAGETGAERRAEADDDNP